ncbi:TetR/AcrR family transcriptional regulator [Streptomyces sp. TRM66268-LWL]|uniref:TetR/AcrR family transcriptional regulator n=1 Tax=Streptomyces polyasparticus TaxID=2767826 RepID=A0ABR7SMP4_9ACTN|nr:TetR/AcrR family transcriptional regulator [Streptomyces polyasparticus]MBC9716629.1 TetR/AcrR family transcriptional regulator [Streptomyces polyasparticus]
MAQADDGTGLPASLATAWGLRERPSRGPKPTLSLDRIVDEAVAIAAADGVEAVSMPRVAKALGVSTMSLYRYVGAKGELLILMQEAATPPAPVLDPAASWRASMERWAREQRKIFYANLWLLRIPLTGPPATPRQVEWMECGLSALADTGLAEEAKLSVLMLVGGYVRNEAAVMSSIDAAIRESGRTPDEHLREYARTLSVLTTPERHPGVTRVLDSGVLQGADGEDDEFEFGLACVLDGVAALIERGGGS